MPPAIAHDPAPTARPLLNFETSDLPQGKVRVNGIERTHPPGARTPWHTSGPKFIHVLEGTLTAHGPGGVTLLTCGPAPKLCFLSPGDGMWFFRNHEKARVRFVLIGIDAVSYPTVHEEVGQVVAIEGNRVTLALGDLRTSDLASPRRQLTLTLDSSPVVAVGDDVVTVRYDEARQAAERLVRLARRWQ